jgi:pyruvate-formate lyase-activating enzyme
MLLVLPAATDGYSTKTLLSTCMFSLIQKFASIRRRGPATAQLPSATQLPAAIRSPVQGYVDERMTTHVTGWMRNLGDPTERVAFEVAVDCPEGARVIANGIADQFDPVLHELSVGDARYGFRIVFPTPLTPDERDSLVVRPCHSDIPLELAPQLQGFVDERSIHHVAGWVRNRSDPAERVRFEVVLQDLDGERILASGLANEFNPVLKQLAIGDATHGFRVLFPQPLSEAERDRVFVRPVGATAPLELAPGLATAFEPVSHVAMDIVNNCNLRCPFCVYDYSNTRNTRVMSEATFDSALRLIPFVTDGNFWLSCLHEATMHPELMRFIDRIPRQWRRKVMYTTNLARPMPDAYFDALAESGLHHVNISLESLDPEVYERMRKGARWRIFAKNWDRLLQAIRAGSNPPRLRYNIMAYRTNLAEIPGLLKYLREERLASQIEVRHTFDVEHIPADFRDTEFLGDDGWAWLAEQLNGYSAEDVLLIPPPVPDAPPAQPQVATTSGSDPVPRLVTRPLNIRMEWDGTLTVYGEWTGLTGVREHERFVVTNVHHLRDPRGFLTSL